MKVSIKMSKPKKYISLILLIALSLSLLVNPQASFVPEQPVRNTYTISYALTASKASTVKASASVNPTQTKKEVDFKKAADIPQGGNILVPIGLLIVFIIGGIFAWIKLKDYFI